MVLNRHHFMDLMFIHLILSLGAITVKVPEEMPESCDSFLHTSNFKDDRDSSNSDLFIMVILLPSGIYGSSIDGKPPPMIQRWRSGGKCNCRGKGPRIQQVAV